MTGLIPISAKRKRRLTSEISVNCGYFAVVPRTVEQLACYLFNLIHNNTHRIIHKGFQTTNTRSVNCTLARKQEYSLTIKRNEHRLNA